MWRNSFERGRRGSLIDASEKGSGKEMKLTTFIYGGETENSFVAYNPDTGTATKGSNRKDTLNNLGEAVALYLWEFYELIMTRCETTLASLEVEATRA
tara:strand:+ start:165 stop:458 length:294 start_codon:yes stop_codon:yes gene_type:complete